MHFPVVLLSAVILTLLLTHAPSSHGAEIFFFFIAGSFSHKVGIWPLVTALADRGHNVTYLSPYEKQPFKPNSTVNDIFLKTHVRFTESAQKVDRLSLRRAGNAKEFWNFKDPDALCRTLLENPTADPQIHDLIYSAKFDLVVVNSVFGECGFILNHRNKAKTVMSSSSFMMPWFHVMHGFPLETSWIPEIMELFQYPMGLKDRVWNTLIPYLSLWWHEKFSDMHAELLRKTYGTEDFQSPIEMERETSLILVNNHFGTTDFARSVPPFVVPIGGMQCWLPKKKLSEEYQSYLDSATDGAILMTFGSATEISDAPDYFKKIIFGAFAKFPKIKFILKWKGELPPEAPRNVKVSSWIPQFEILGHPNVKAFITHGGGNGFMEAVYYGVPLIVLPLYADQDYNAYVVEATGMGIKLEVETLEASEELEKAIFDILNVKSYSDTMKVKSGIFRDRPMDPISTGVYWIEFVLNHDDTRSLKPLTHLNVYQQQKLDVYLVLWAIGTLVLVSAYILLKFSIRFMFSLCGGGGGASYTSKPVAKAGKKQKKK